MAKSRSESSKYESRYGGGHITAAQYLAELMCERIAKKNKKELVPHFWKTSLWKQTFCSQLLAANALLKLYEIKAITLALKENLHALSLRTKFLDPIIKDKQERLNREAAATPQVIERVEPTNPFPAKPFIEKKSILDKLRDLE